MKRALFAKAPVFGERFAAADYKFAAPKRRKRRRTAQGVFERSRSVFEEGRTRNFEGIFAISAKNLQRQNCILRSFQTRSSAKFACLRISSGPVTAQGNAVAAEAFAAFETLQTRTPSGFNFRLRSGAIATNPARSSAPNAGRQRLPEAILQGNNGNSTRRHPFYTGGNNRA